MENNNLSSASFAPPCFLDFIFMLCSEALFNIDYSMNDVYTLDMKLKVNDNLVHEGPDKCERRSQREVRDR